jgi:hypothetical protein
VNWKRTSTIDRLPDDPVGAAMAATLSEVLVVAAVELVYSPAESPLPAEVSGPAVSSATDAGPPGWRITLTVRLAERIAPLVRTPHTPLRDTLSALPGAGLRAAAAFRSVRETPSQPFGPAFRRALRDTIAAELLADLVAARSGRIVTADLIAETIDFLIELSGSRVESHDLTHGVVITDALEDTPVLRLAYPADVRTAKRAPLLFDGRRSVLIVDLQGRARTELQRHRIGRLGPAISSGSDAAGDSSDSGSLVTAASRRLGGIGFFLRADRTIWGVIDGQPMLVRRGEHWTAFPLELAASIARMIGGGAAAQIVVEAAFMISGQRHGAILAIVEDADVLDGNVSLKDRYDLRDRIDPEAVRTETRLHHLIDADDELDEYTLARLAALDGATIVDRDSRLLAYGAIVPSRDSEHEGARTAAAKTLSHIAHVVLKVSADGDITIFREGTAVTTLLRHMEPQ